MLLCLCARHNFSNVAACDDLHITCMLYWFDDMQNVSFSHNMRTILDICRWYNNIICDVTWNMISTFDFNLLNTIEFRSSYNNSQAKTRKREKWKILNDKCTTIWQVCRKNFYLYKNFFVIRLVDYVAHRFIIFLIFINNISVVCLSSQPFVEISIIANLSDFDLLFFPLSSHLLSYEQASVCQFVCHFSFIFCFWASTIFILRMTYLHNCAINNLQGALSKDSSRCFINFLWRNFHSISNFELVKPQKWCLKLDPHLSNHHDDIL
jgi:hypothetical protein